MQEVVHLTEKESSLAYKILTDLFTQRTAKKKIVYFVDLDPRDDEIRWGVVSGHLYEKCRADGLLSCGYEKKDGDANDYTFRFIYRG